jgi:hypothetical protein
MKKYIVFYPKDVDHNDDPNDSVLWDVKYKVHQTISGLPEYIHDLLETMCSEPFPLNRWKKEFELLGLELIYDYPYMKEYAIMDDKVVLFTATLLALDINKYNNEIIVKNKTGQQLLKSLNLNEKGSMHPEKFHNMMVQFVDLSDDEYIKNEDISDFLYNLETLCERCLQYESKIEWKTIS